jgi:hypothetical protein
LPNKLAVEDILPDEFKREKPRHRRLRSVGRLRFGDAQPIEYAGYNNKVGDMKILYEMTDMLAGTDFSVKSSESQKKQLAQFTKAPSTYCNLVFTKKIADYRGLTHFPKLKADSDRSTRIVSAAKSVVDGGNHETASERGKFNDFLVEVKSYVNLLGDIYRQTFKM